MRELNKPLYWEFIDTTHRRAAIPGGWLVKAYDDDLIFCEAMCFVPDMNHEWRFYVD